MRDILPPVAQEDGDEPDKIGGVNRSRQLFLRDARLYKAIRASTIIVCTLVIY